MPRIARAARKRTATFVEERDHTKFYRFPMPDKAHARNALARVEQGKTNITPAERASVVRRACRILYGAGKEYRGCLKRHSS